LINNIATTFYQYIAGNATIMTLMVIAIVVIMLFAIRNNTIDFNNDGFNSND